MCEQYNQRTDELQHSWERWFTDDAWEYFKRGLRTSLPVSLLNPGAVMASPHFVWRHQVCVGAEGLCVFDNPVFGVRAVARILYISLHHEGNDNLLDLVARYSGAKGAVLTNYVRFVVDRIGRAATERFDMHEYSREIVTAVCAFETGPLGDTIPAGNVWNEMIFSRGLALSHEW